MYMRHTRQCTPANLRLTLPNTMSLGARAVYPGLSRMREHSGSMGWLQFHSVLVCQGCGAENQIKGFEREPDLRRPGGQRLQWPFRLHVLSPAIRVQPAWRSGAVCPALGATSTAPTAGGKCWSR